MQTVYRMEIYIVINLMVLVWYSRFQCFFVYILNQSLHRLTFQNTYM
jgi:hypothetical protein